MTASEVAIILRLQPKQVKISPVESPLGILTRVDSEKTVIDSPMTMVQKVLARPK